MTPYTKQMFKGIIWREKQLYGPALNLLFCLWLSAVWVLQLFDHPAWFLAFGFFYSLIIGQMAGGNEAYDGAEEFTFALPPGRSQRYWSKFAFSVPLPLRFRPPQHAPSAIHNPLV